MNSSKKISGGFSSGYKIKNGKNIVINNNNKNKKNEFSDKQYPNGMVPFIFITLFFIISTSCIFGIGFGKYSDIFSLKQVWTNTLICCVTLPFLLNLLWLLGRTGFMDTISYSLLKVSRNLKINKARQKIEFYVTDPAINDVSTIGDFKEFSSIRKEKSTKWFYISIITYTLIFVIGLIISLVMQYI